MKGVSILGQISLQKDFFVLQTVFLHKSAKFNALFHTELDNNLIRRVAVVSFSIVRVRHVLCRVYCRHILNLYYHV